MNTTENNKLIAKFLGYNKTTMNNGKKELWTTTDNLFSDKYHEFTEGLIFHSDWNWLMEVVEKIEQNSIYKFRIEGEVISINNTDIIHSYRGNFFKTSKSKIEAVYNACVEFIKQYNSAKKDENNNNN